HAQVDGPPAALDGHLRILAHAEDHIGRHLPLAERPDRTLPRQEVTVDAGPRLGGCDPGEHRRIERFHVDAGRVDAHVAYPGDDVKIPGRLELRLHRQSGRLPDRLTAAADIERTLVRGCRASG